MTSACKSCSAAWPRARRSETGWRDNRHFWRVSNAEHLKMSEDVGMINVSHFAKIDVQGPDAADLLEYICVAKVGGDAPVGKGVYTHFMEATGGVRADLTVLRLGATLCTLTMTSNIDSTGVARYPMGACAVMDPATGATLIDAQGRRSYTTSIAFGPRLARTFRWPTCRTNIARWGANCKSSTLRMSIRSRSRRWDTNPCTTRRMASRGPDSGHGAIGAIAVGADTLNRRYRPDAKRRNRRSR